MSFSTRVQRRMQDRAGARRLADQVVSTIVSEEIDDDPELERWPGAGLVVRAEVTDVFLNCGRYIHKHRRVSRSPYVPDAQGDAPHPSWKRIDALQPVMPEHVRERTARAGGVITSEDHERKVAEGTS